MDESRWMLSYLTRRRGAPVRRHNLEGDRSTGFSLQETRNMREKGILKSILSLSFSLPSILLLHPTRSSFFSFFLFYSSAQSPPLRFTQSFLSLHNYFLFFFFFFLSHSYSLLFFNQRSSSSGVTRFIQNFLLHGRLGVNFIGSHLLIEILSTHIVFRFQIHEGIGESQGTQKLNKVKLPHASHGV